MADEKRRCKATTRAGEPCRSTSLWDNGLCFGHQPAEVKAKHGFSPENGKRGGRPRKPTLIEVWREQVEKDYEKVLAVFREGLEAERALVVGNGPTAHLETAPDIPTRIKAAESYVDRVYGKPTQTTELSGPGGKPIEHDVVELPKEEDFHRQVAEILAEAGAAGD